MTDKPSPKPETQSLVPVGPQDTFSVVQIERMAEAVAKSGLFKHVVRTPQEAFTLMMIAHAEGIHPMAALGRYSIINGRPAKASAAMLSDFKKRGGAWEWVKDGSDGEAVVRLSAPHLIQPVEGRFSMKEAKAAGLLRQGGSYDKFGAAMLRARAVSGGLRMADPVCAQLYTPEEGDAIPPSPATGYEEAEPVEAADEPLREPEALPAGNDEEPPPPDEPVYDAQDLADGVYDDDPTVFPDGPPGQEEAPEPEPAPIIDEPARRGLFAKANEFGVAPPVLKAVVNYFGFESTKLVTADKYKDILAFLEQGEEYIRGVLRNKGLPEEIEFAGKGKT